MRLLALILSTIMISLTTGTILAAEGQAVCVGCLALPKDTLVTNVQTTRNAVANSLAPQILYERMEYLGIDRACRNFSGPTEYGPIGKYMMKSMTPEKYPSMFEGTPDIKENCPAWDSFTDEDKKSFYVYVFAHFSFAESSCRPNAIAPGLRKGDYAAGLYGLHKNREDYYTRPKRYLNKCLKGDSSNGLNSTRCTLALVEGQMSGRDALFTPSAHFEPLTGTSPRHLKMQILRSNGATRYAEVPLKTFIKTSIQKYPLCK